MSEMKQQLTAKMIQENKNSAEYLHIWTKQFVKSLHKKPEYNSSQLFNELGNCISITEKTSPNNMKVVR